MTTPPSLSVMVARPIYFVVGIDLFEADIYNRLYQRIRFAPDAATVSLQDYLPRLFRLLRHMISIGDLEFGRVQISRWVVVIFVLVVLLVSAANPILIVIINDCLNQGYALFHLHTLPKVDSTTTHSTKHLVHFWCRYYNRSENILSSRFIICSFLGALIEPNHQAVAIAPPQEKFSRLHSRLIWIGLLKYLTGENK